MSPGRFAAGGGTEMEPEVVLITGCSTGIGRATATTLATAGYEVVATARRPEELEAIATRWHA